MFLLYIINSLTSTFKAPAIFSIVSKVGFCLPASKLLIYARSILVALNSEDRDSGAGMFVYCSFNQPSSSIIYNSEVNSEDRDSGAGEDRDSGAGMFVYCSFLTPKTGTPELVSQMRRRD
jgi:hypothetical protein